MDLNFFKKTRILDGNGAYIQEELLAVKFADIDDYLDEDAEE